MAVNSDIGPFGIVPLWFLKRGVTSEAVHVYAILATVYADRDGKAWPKRDTLAQQCGMGLNTLDRALKELIRVGAIVRERRWREGGGQTSSMYVVRYSKPGEHDHQIEGSCHHEPQIEGSHDPQTEGSCHCSYEPDPIRTNTVEVKSTSTVRAVERRLQPSVVFEAFLKAWQPAYPNQKHAFTARHGHEAKRLLTVLSPDEIAARAKRYVASREKFYVDAKHEFSLFVSHINRFVESAQEREATEAGPTVESTNAMLRRIREHRARTSGGRP